MGRLRRADGGRRGPRRLGDLKIGVSGRKLTLDGNEYSNPACPVGVGGDFQTGDAMGR